MASPEKRTAAHATPREDQEFLAALAAAIAASGRGQPAALLHLDVARAGDIETTCGQSAIRALQDLIEAVVHNQIGPAVPACLVGIGEASLLLPDTLPADAVVRAKRIRGALDQGRFSWHGHPFRLGAHVGLVELGPQPEEPQAWLALVRRACQAARDLGGSGIQLVTLSDHAWQDLEREQEWRRHLTEVM